MHGTCVRLPLHIFVRATASSNRGALGESSLLYSACVHGPCTAPCQPAAPAVSRDARERPFQTVELRGAARQRRAAGTTHGERQRRWLLPPSTDGYPQPLTPHSACHRTPRAHDTHAIALSLDEKPLWLVRYRRCLAEGSPPRVCVAAASTYHVPRPRAPLSFCDSHALWCVSAGLRRSRWICSPRRLSTPDRF
jgi:hypothetical protein